MTDCYPCTLAESLIEELSEAVDEMSLTWAEEADRVGCWGCSFAQLRRHWVWLCLAIGCFGSAAGDKLAAGTRFAERVVQIGRLVQAAEVVVGSMPLSFEFASSAETSYLS